MSNPIQVKNLYKKYKEHIVLNNVNVEFEENKIHGIIGRNGSGKTMLFKCICGFVPVTSGEIKVNNKIIGKEIDVPENTGIIIENPGFLPNYSGFNNLKLLAGIKNIITKDKIKETILRVGLDPENKKKVSKYSLGMKQRLGIAQAIMEDPALIILDEPMNGIDKSGVEDIRKLLLDLKSEGKTILIASHNAEDIRVLCDEVYEMDNGFLVNIGT